MNASTYSHCFTSKTNPYSHKHTNNVNKSSKGELSMNKPNDKDNSVDSPHVQKLTKNCNNLTNVAQELQTLIQQLSTVTKNKNVILSVIHQLQDGYKNMTRKNQEQEKEIKNLKEKNKVLVAENKILLAEKEQQSTEDEQDTKKLRATLESCESKLGALEANMEKMLTNYLKPNQQLAGEKALVEENRKLLKSNYLLKCQLKQALTGLEKYKNVAFNAEKMCNALNEKYQQYVSLMKEKTKDANMLMASAINRLDKTGPQYVSDIEDIKQKYERILIQQENLDTKWKLFEENDIKRLQGMLLHNEKALETELQNFKQAVKISFSKEMLDVFESDANPPPLSISTLNDPQVFEKEINDLRKEVHEAVCTHQHIQEENEEIVKVHEASATPEQIEESETESCTTEVQTVREEDEERELAEAYYEYELECECVPCEDSTTCLAEELYGQKPEEKSISN